MAAFYDGLKFRTSLEARWAAFFDLAGWTWRANPAAVDNWAPDFRVIFPCDHSECGGHHTLLVAVLPVNRLEDFRGHPCLDHSYGEGIKADGGAAFGNSPEVTWWEIVHGAGGGVEDIAFRVHDADALWITALTMVS